MTGRWAAIALTVASLCLPAPGRAQFAASPVILPLEAIAGPADQVIRIDNEGDQPMQFRVYVADFDQDAGGNHVFSAPESSARSCGTRLQVTPTALSVPAGGRALVRVRLDASATPDTCWSMVFVEAPKTTEGGVRINERIGIKAYGIGAGARPDGVVTTAEAHSVGDSVSVRFAVLNPGEWPVRPEGSVEIRDLSGVVVVQVPVPAFTVLPQRERAMEVTLPAGGLEAGPYLALPILDVGADFLVGAQADFQHPGR